MHPLTYSDTVLIQAMANAGKIHPNARPCDGCHQLTRCDPWTWPNKGDEVAPLALCLDCTGKAQRWVNHAIDGHTVTVFSSAAPYESNGITTPFDFLTLRERLAIDELRNGQADWTEAASAGSAVLYWHPTPPYASPGCCGRQTSKRWQRCFNLRLPN
jgi:hypothetical protein